MTQTQFYTCASFIYWGVGGGQDGKTKLGTFINSCISLATYQDIHGDGYQDRVNNVVDVLESRKYECIVREVD